MTNQVLENMRTRRSCRAYKSDMVPQEVLEQIIEAGLYAPSSLGEQSATIIAVTDKAARDKLSKLNASFMPGKEGTDPFYGAPVVLIVLAEKKRQAQFCDGCLVMENMMLAAHTLGYASCWIHRALEMFESDEGKAFLKDIGVNGDFVGVGNCIVGLPAWEQLPLPPARKDGRVVFVK